MTTATKTVSLGISQRIAAAAVAMILGGVLLYGAGFASANTLHNAAHDGRHAFAFPCH